MEYQLSISPPPYNIHGVSGKTPVTWPSSHQIHSSEGSSTKNSSPNRMHLKNWTICHKMTTLGLPGRLATIAFRL